MPIERMNALLSGEKTDRISVWLWLLSATVAAVHAGYSLHDIFSSPEKNFWSQVWTQEMYGTEDFPRPCFGGEAALPFGGKAKLPTGEYEQSVSVTQYPVSSEEEAWNLKIPGNLANTEPTAKYLEFAALQAGHGFPISVWIDSPFELVRGICGADLLMRWLIKKPELVHHLLKLAVDYGIKLAKLWTGKFPAERIMVQSVAPSSSNQMISPRQFEVFSLPYEIERNEKILAMGIKHIYCHICGEHNMNLKYWSQIPMGNPGIASFGHEVDIDDATNALGETCIISGNIEPAVIQTGKPDEVYELCRQVVEKGKHAPRGFILMPGCGISHRVPLYNLYMLKKAAEAFGYY